MRAVEGEKERERRDGEAKRRLERRDRGRDRDARELHRETIKRARDEAQRKYRKRKVDLTHTRMNNAHRDGGIVGGTTRETNTEVRSTKRLAEITVSFPFMISFHLYCLFELIFKRNFKITLTVVARQSQILYKYVFKSLSLSLFFMTVDDLRSHIEN